VAPSSLRDTDGPSTETNSTVADRAPADAHDAAAPESENPSDIQSTLDGWAKAINDNNVTLEMRYYGDRLDRYFLARDVTQDFVAQDKAQFYRKGKRFLDYHVENVIVDQQSPEKATVSLVKRWTISDGFGTKSGEIRSRLWLTRDAGHWTITGEQDLLKSATHSRNTGSELDSDIRLLMVAYWSVLNQGKYLGALRR
jgi:hypothetical protein